MGFSLEKPKLILIVCDLSTPTLSYKADRMILRALQPASLDGTHNIAPNKKNPACSEVGSANRHSGCQLSSVHILWHTCVLPHMQALAKQPSTNKPFLYRLQIC